MQFELQHSALLAHDCPMSVQPPDPLKHRPSRHVPSQQSELARHADVLGMHIVEQRRTPIESRTHSAPLQHCELKSHVLPSGMQAV